MKKSWNDLSNKEKKDIKTTVGVTVGILGFKLFKEYFKSLSKIQKIKFWIFWLNNVIIILFFSEYKSEYGGKIAIIFYLNIFWGISNLLKKSDDWKKFKWIIMWNKLDLFTKIILIFLFVICPIIGLLLKLNE